MRLQDEVAFITGGGSGLGRVRGSSRPKAPAWRCPRKDDDEAIHIANDSDEGLHGVLFTRDPNRALAKQLPRCFSTDAFC
jgi:hypothetical protein